MDHEHANGEHVEGHPAHAAKEVEFELVDVPDRHWGNCRVRGPEQIQMNDALKVDHVTRWTHQVWLGSTQAELEQVDDHESHKQYTSDRKVEISIDAPFRRLI